MHEFACICPPVRMSDHGVAMDDFVPPYDGYQEVTCPNCAYPMWMGPSMGSYLAQTPEAPPAICMPCAIRTGVIDRATPVKHFGEL